MECASAPSTTGTSGAAEQPARLDVPAVARSSAPRAAASAVKFAIVAPVVRPTPASRGRPSRSSSQLAAASSAAAAAGVGSAKLPG